MFPLIPRVKLHLTINQSDPFVKPIDEWKLKRSLIDYLASSNSLSVPEDDLEICGFKDLKKCRREDPVVFGSLCIRDLGFLSENKRKNENLSKEGVVGPIVIMYSYLYNCYTQRKDLGTGLFLAWAGWVCVWTTLMLFIHAIFNACNVIIRFTRIASELFGTLIIVFFMQETVKGLLSEFKIPERDDPQTEQKNQFQWLYTNGLLGIVISFGVLYTSLRSRMARSWLYGTGGFRGIIADYEVPLMVFIWTTLSFTVLSKVSTGVPRRLVSPLPWEVASLYHWTVIKDMVRIPPVYIFAAIVPALMITALYF